MNTASNSLTRKKNFPTSSQDNLVEDFALIVARARKQRGFKMLRLPELAEKVGLSQPTIWRRIQEGTFPPAIPIGDRAVAWFEHEIDAVLEAIGVATRRKMTLDLALFISALTSAEPPGNFRES